MASAPFVGLPAPPDPRRPTAALILDPIAEAAAVAELVHDLAVTKLNTDDPLEDGDREVLLSGLGAVRRLTGMARDAGVACQW